MSENKGPYEVVFDPRTGLQTSDDVSIRERAFGEYRLASSLTVRWTVKGKKKKKTPKRTPRRPGKKRGK